MPQIYTFSDQAEFVTWLRVQPESSIGFAFLVGPYPITLEVSRTNNKLVLKQV